MILAKRAVFGPLALIVSGAMLLGFRSNAVLFTVVVGLVSVWAVWDLIDLVRRPAQLGYARALAVSILLGYGVGSATYLISNRTVYASDFQYWAPQGLLFDQEGLSTALAACVFAAAALYLLGNREWGSSPTQDDVTAAVSLEATGRYTERLVWAGAVIVAFAMLRGDFGYMGASAGVRLTGGLSPLGAMASLLAPPLVPIAVLLIRASPAGVRKWRLAIPLALLSIALVLAGRRYLLYVTLLSLIAWVRGSAITVARPRRVVSRPRPGLWLILAAAGSMVLYWGFLFFLSLRLATGRLGSGASLLSTLELALSQLSGDSRAAVQASLGTNLAGRPFILSYFAGLAGIKSTGVPTGGKELVYSLQMAIPSSLVPDKAALLARAPEDLIHPLYGIWPFDGPNSIVLAGFDDWGLAGTVLYPVLVAVLYHIFYKVATRLVPYPPVKLLIWFSLLFQMFYVEQGLSSVFVTLRDLTLVVAVAWLAMQFERGATGGRARARTGVTQGGSLARRAGSEASVAFDERLGTGLADGRDVG